MKLSSKNREKRRQKNRTELAKEDQSKKWHTVGIRFPSVIPPSPPIRGYFRRNSWCGNCAKSLCREVVLQWKRTYGTHGWCDSRDGVV